MFAKQLKQAAALALLAAAAGGGAAHAQATTGWSGSPRTSEEDRQFKINGRVHYDVYGVNADFAGTANDEEYVRSAARRVLLGVEGRFTKTWRYNIKLQINPSTDDTTGEVGVDDGFLEYAGDAFSFFIGQNNAISPLEDRTSSNEIPFNERSAVINAFDYKKTMGIAVLTGGGNWSLGASLSGDDLNNTEPAAATADADEAAAVMARGTFAPIYQATPDGTTVLHLGAHARVRDNGGDAGYRYRARPNVGFGPRFVDTAAFAKQDTAYGAEAAFQYNSFGAEAEYIVLDAKQNVPNGAERQFSGGYVDLFWSPTGESRNYNASDGSFGRINPFKVLGSDGGIGHVMLSARYDWLDLTDGAEAGAGDFGTQKTWTVGATWKPIAYVKFQANYGQSEINLPGANSEGDADVFTVRTQIDW